jgi:hypothetical protein
MPFARIELVVPEDPAPFEMAFALYIRGDAEPKLAMLPRAKAIALAGRILEHFCLEEEDGETPEPARGRGGEGASFRPDDGGAYPGLAT